MYLLFKNISLLYKFLQCEEQFNLSFFASLIAILISLFALIISRSYARKNILLSIHQTIIKIVSDKVMECNILWENELLQGPNSPHIKVISELIITTEIIDKSLTLFEKNYKRIEKLSNDYYFLFWKQLRTGLRGWIRDNTKEIADKFNNKYYSEQIEYLHKKFEKYFEKIK